LDPSSLPAPPKASQNPSLFRDDTIHKTKAMKTKPSNRYSDSLN